MWVIRRLVEEKLHKIGKIAHFFTKINVAIVELTGSLSVGDKILIQGSTTNFEQVIDSIQVEHENIEAAKAGESIGLKVKERVREEDIVYKILS